MSRRRILITGCCGYIGSALVRYLAEREDATLRLVDNLSNGDPQALMNLPEGTSYEFIEGDILDPGLLRVVTADVDAVVHLAAVVRNPLSFDYSREFEQVNHWGTAHVVEACLNAGVKHLIYVSSTAVYGPGTELTEESETRPVGSFANSVLNAEQSVRAANVRGLPVSVLRAGVVYGSSPNIRFDEVINRLAFLAGTGRPLTVFGEGEQRRPIVHVRDLCDAVRFVLNNRNARYETYNVLHSSPSILEIKDAIVSAAPQVRIRYTEQDLRTRLSFAASSEKLANAGWSASTDLSSGVADLLRHFAGFVDWRNAEAVEE